MLSITSAQNAMKSVYLNVVSEQLNINANAFLSRIKQTSKDVYGKEIIKLAPYGMNGGIAACDETSNFPTSYQHNFIQFKSSLKNLYGKISLSDKAIRASANSAGAFVNLITDEMNSLIKSSSFNLGRMLYGDGTGCLATATVTDGEVTFDSVKDVVEGMRVDVYNGNTPVAYSDQITYVDRASKKITFATSVNFVTGYKLYANSSKGNEITGIKRIFDKTNANSVIYGVDRTSYPWLYPYINENNSTLTDITDAMIQKAMNSIEEESGAQVDFISVAGDVRTAYQAYLTNYRRNIDVTTLQGGYKAMTYAGIPVVYERFVEDGVMYLLNSKDFNIHQLCDWEWLEDENGCVLIRSANAPSMSAILVKYAELICDRPSAQGKISYIKPV